MMKFFSKSIAAQTARLAFRRMHSTQFIGGKSLMAEGPMMSRQKDLPRLPVPPLQDTLRRCLDFLKPLVTAQQLEETRKVVHDFGKPGGEGEKLHRLLAVRASSTHNWLFDWFLDAEFLRPRRSVICSSVAMAFPRQIFATKKDQLMHAALLTAGALNYKHLIDRQLIQPEVSGTSPLDMSQYQKMFSVYRMPSEGCDKVEFNTPDESGGHVIVIHNNQIFSFDACDARGILHDQSVILTQLTRVVEMSREKDVGVGILTAEDRDAWAKVYDTLSRNSQNAASLEAIRRAAVVVCLDGRLNNPEPYEVTCPQQIYMGGLNTENAANRWWDKPVQIIVGEEGLSALLFEHSSFDGTVMAGLTNHSHDYLMKTGRFDTSGHNAAGAAPQKVEFELGSETLRDIEMAKSSPARFAGNTERLLFKFADYGKSFVKSCNMSPDGYVQMAMQLAACRTYGFPVSTVGTASTRKFLYGRADGIRASTEESLSFCRVFDNPRSSRADKEESLRKAVLRYKQDAVLAGNGLGASIILYGLIKTAIEHKIPLHPFFQHFPSSESWLPKLITIQLNLGSDVVSIMDPVIPNGYTVLYNIRPDCFTFGLTCSKSCPEQSAVKFKDALQETLTEMKDLLDPVSGGE